MNTFLHPLFLFFLFISCASLRQKSDAVSTFILKQDRGEGTISVFRAGGHTPLLVQNAQTAVRPYIHPIMTPDGKGQMTEFSPAHHKHQTGLYWGLKQVNGRDYFMNWKEDYWQKVSADVIGEKGAKVKWRTIYNLLDAMGNVIMAETQVWSFQERNGKFILDLEWSGEAKTDVTIGKFYVGGLFLRMPWREGIEGQVINASGQRNGEAEGARAIWNDIGIRIDGSDDPAHVAILDHPDNQDFPVAWRVDHELGVGPSRQILGDWSIPKGDREVIRYRLLIYTGALDPLEIADVWKEYVHAGD